MTKTALSPADPPAAQLEAGAKLLIGGTPFGTWPALGEAIAAAVSAAGAVQHRDGAVPARTWQIETPAEPLDARRAPAGVGQRWLVFVESPASALARALAAELQLLEPGSLLPDDAQARALRTWREGAARWLRHTHSRRRQCLLIDTAEAQSNPAGLASVLAGWLDLKLDALSLPAPAPDDALLGMLAGAAVAADRRASDLHEELLASCQPLPDPPATAPVTTPDATATLVRLLQLSRLESTQSLLDAERQQLLQDLHKAHLALERATSSAVSGEESARQVQAAAQARQAALEAESAAHAETQARLQSALEAAAGLKSQLDRLDAELESSRRRESRTADVLRVSESHLRQARQEHALLQAQHADAVASLQAAQDQLQSAAQASLHQQASLAEAELRIDALRAEEQQARSQAGALERSLALSRQEQQALQAALASTAAELATASSLAEERARENESLTAALHRQSGQSASLLAHARTESGGLMLQLARLQERHQALGVERRLAQESAEALRGQLAAREQRLGQVEEAWARDLAHLRELQPRLAAAEQDLSAQREQGRSLQQELEQRKLEAVTRAADHGRDLERQESLWRGQLARMSEGLRASLASALKGQEQLALQLYAAQQAGPGLRSTPAGWSESARATPCVQAEGLYIVHFHDEAPHRELLVQLENVRLRGASLPQLAVKLVEHEGRPGLAMLGSPGAPTQALAQWQPTLVEDGRELMLLVPADRAGRERLQRLGSSDWRTVLELVDRLRRLAETPEPPLARHWPVIAARLQAQMLGLRSRLRYDGLDVRPLDDGPGGFEFRLHEPLWGQRPWPALHARWRPASPRAELMLVLPGSSSPEAPLGNWPVAGDGTLESSFVLHLGTGFPARDRMRWWSRLSDQDRELILAILDTLPAVIDRAGANLPAGWTASKLLRQAQALRRQARRSILAGRLGLGLVRALRRGSPTT